VEETPVPVAATRPPAQGGIDVTYPCRWSASVMTVTGGGWIAGSHSGASIERICPMGNDSQPSGGRALKSARRGRKASLGRE
jgi:hypothetical protein